MISGGFAEGTGAEGFEGGGRGNGRRRFRGSAPLIFPAGGGGGGTSHTPAPGRVALTPPPRAAEGKDASRETLTGTPPRDAEAAPREEESLP